MEARLAGERAGAEGGALGRAEGAELVESLTRRCEEAEVRRGEAEAETTVAAAARDAAERELRAALPAAAAATAAAAGGGESPPPLEPIPGSVSRQSGQAPRPPPLHTHTLAGAGSDSDNDGNGPTDQEEDEDEDDEDESIDEDATQSSIDLPSMGSSYPNTPNPGPGSSYPNTPNAGPGASPRGPGPGVPPIAEYPEGGGGGGDGGGGGGGGGGAQTMGAQEPERERMYRAQVDELISQNERLRGSVALMRTEMESLQRGMLASPRPPPSPAGRG